MTRSRFEAREALEVLGPHGWYYRLDPASVENVWPCGPCWSWVRMSGATKGPLLVRGNAVDLLARRDALLARRARKEQSIDAHANEQ